MDTVLFYLTFKQMVVLHNQSMVCRDKAMPLYLYMCRAAVLEASLLSLFCYDKLFHSAEVWNNKILCTGIHPVLST